MKAACWLAWATMTLAWVTFFTEATPVSMETEPCQLDDDPTLGDLVLFRLCIEAEQEESQLKDLLKASGHAQPETSDDLSEWPEAPEEDEQFPYCYPLSTAQCRMLLITLDDILRLSENDSSNNDDDDDDEESNRVKRSSASRLFEKYRAKLHKDKRWNPRNRKVLEEYIKQASQRSGHRNMGGRFGRSVDSWNDDDDNHHEEINEQNSEHDIERRETAVIDDENTDVDDVEHMRLKRAVLSRMPTNARALLAAYKAWRDKNGYGKATFRWG